MTPELTIQALLGGCVLLLAWRAVDGWLSVMGKRSRRSKEMEELREQVKKMSLEFSKLPMDVPDVRDLEAVSEQVDQLSAQLAAQRTEVSESKRTLITRESAEKIVNQVNKVTLEVEALKEWQSTLSSTSELAQAFGVETKEKLDAS